MENKKYICPICGYDKLEQEPVASYEICPCCGYELGTCEYFNKSNYPVDVGYEFGYKENIDFFKFVRELWLKQGAKWFREDKKPNKWNLETQLKNIEKIDK